MIELPLIALGGLLGSSHCVGMCGGFVVSIGSAASGWGSNLLRQCAFGFGRMFTYGSLGLVAGYGGNRLVASTTFVDMQAILAVATGLLLVVQGARSSGAVAWLRRKSRSARTGDKNLSSPVLTGPRASASHALCLQRGLLRSLLQQPGPTGPMLAGVLTGFLPCGLVYAMLALAVNTDGPLQGALVMVCFGVGTLPVLTALGLGTSLLGFSARRQLLQVAALCVIAVGGVSIARGVAAWNAHASSETGATTGRCPLCRE